MLLSILYNFFFQNKKQLQDLDQYGRILPPKRGEWYTPGITTDAIVIKNNSENKQDVLMITRKNDPYKGFLCFPGGFIEYNEEPMEGCLRELKEETNLQGVKCELFTVKGDPQRDPRQHTISLFYLVNVAPDAQPYGGDDAETARFYPLREILNKKEKVGFDHYSVLDEVVNKMYPNYKLNN